MGNLVIAPFLQSILSPTVTVNTVNRRVNLVIAPLLQSILSPTVAVNTGNRRGI